jgi:2-aminoadipate transaminase
MTLLDQVARARRAQVAVPSAVREILKVTERPEVISFAGGLPAEELFPVAEMERAFRETLSLDGRAALQYATTEGFRDLRAWIAARMTRHGRAVRADDLVITHGSQQGIDLVARVLLDEGDTVVVESPSYLAALQTFRAAEARIVSVPIDRDGIDVAELERVFREERPKLLYLVPDHQNPSGAQLSLERRHRVLALCRRYRVPVLEDDPYGEISFAGPRLPPLYALDDAGSVIYLSTFSKTLAPALRIGWVAAPAGFLRSIAIAKQGADLHTGSLPQRAAARLLETFDYEAHLVRIREVYRARALAMEAAIKAHFPREASWVSPRGGLFLWVGIEADISIDRLFAAALAENVAFVPGDPFFPEATPKPHMRLNFSHRRETVISEGIRRLGAALRAEMGAGDCVEARCL